MKIVFMGTSEIAMPVLEMLIHGEDDLVAVVTQPDRPRGRGRKLASSPVKETAELENIPILQPENPNTDEFAGELSGYEPELIVVMSYGRILGRALLSAPYHGCINIHASLLPKYRGAAPIQWALINGETETGVTTIQMDEGMDTGEILLQQRVSIAEDDTAATLQEKLAQAAAECLENTLEALKAGTLQPTPQDTMQASMAPLLKKEDGKIDWTLPAGEISNRVRALDPWPGSFTELNGNQIHICMTKVAEGSGWPGMILEVNDDDVVVACGKDALRIVECQPAGKRRMKTCEFLCGHKLEAGMHFGE